MNFDKKYSLTFICNLQCQQVLPQIKQSVSKRSELPGAGRIIILSSACDTIVTYRGWMSYCTSKAALSRFIQLLAHEESTIDVLGVYPRLTRTKMPEDVIAGRFKDIMADDEIQRFKDWSAQGDKVVEPAEWCGEVGLSTLIRVYICLIHSPTVCSGNCDWAERNWEKRRHLVS